MSSQKLILVIAAVFLLGGGSLLMRFFLAGQAETESLESAWEEIEEALEVRRDYSAALQLANQAISDHPEDWRVHLLRGRAYDGRGRHGDALKALARAEELAGSDEAEEEIRFFSARARIGRFLETHQREDFNLAAADLEGEAEGGTYQAAARILLGLALAEDSPLQDEARALELLRQGLGDDPDGRFIIRPGDARALRDRLEK